MTYSRADIIKMENGKKDLPTGITKSQHGSYRLQRTVNRVDYRFGSIQNLELALRINKGIDKMARDFKLISENSNQASVDELTRQVENLQMLITDQNLSIGKQINIESRMMSERILNLSDERKPFWQRVFGR